MFVCMLVNVQCVHVCCYVLIGILYLAMIIEANLLCVIELTYDMHLPLVV